MKNQRKRSTDREHVVTLLVNSVFFFGHVELPEEVEGDDGVNVDDNGKEHDRQDELLPVVSDGFQDNPQRSHTNSHVQEVRGEEKVVVVAQNRKHEVPQLVQEGLRTGTRIDCLSPLSLRTTKKAHVVCDGDSSLPHLVAPINAHQPTRRNH